VGSVWCLVVFPCRDGEGVTLSERKRVERV